MADKITRHASVRDLEIDAAMRTAERFARLGKIDKAAPTYQRILDRDPNHAGAQAKLAELAFATNAFDIAAGLAQRALARDPHGPYALGAALLLGQTMQVLRRPRDAAAAYRRAATLDPANADAHIGLGTALVDLGEREQAAASFRTAVELAPENARAAHMLAALGGTSGNSTFVRDLFDDYAGYFEQHLTTRLGYRLPDDMRQAVEAVAPGRHFATALDLGCGTGLVAERFAGLYDAIDGVDLSPKMIDIARAKGRYRDLTATDIADFLATPRRPYDLVIAADTAVYVGDLTATFAGLATAMPPDGFLALSIELVPGDSFTIQASARYAHSKPYIERLAAAQGFTPPAFTDVPIRLENGVPIPGSIALMSRRV
ncbi:MAG TPA: tetratricopeptide repeat protein [Devosia sp.]